MGSLSLLQGIIPTQGLNPLLVHCRQILYHLSHQRSPKNTGVGCYSLLQGTFLHSKYCFVCVCVCVFLKEWINRRYCQTLLMKRRVNFWGHLWSRSWVVQSDGVDWEQDIWWRIRTRPDPRVPGRNQLLRVLAFLKSNDLLFTSVLLF